MAKHELTNFLENWVNNLIAEESPLVRNPGFSWYIKDIVKYLNMPGHESRITLLPFLDEKIPQTTINKYYFYQDTWAARKVFEIHPSRLMDIGSTALLVGILSQFVPTLSMDVRPLPVSMPGLECISGSVTKLPLESRSIELVSTMCVIEHIGLGRYGDKLDARGSVKAINEISRVIAPGGSVLFSVPVSHSNQVCFNAHRIFTKQTILDLFKGFELQDEMFLFPDPGSESDIAGLPEFQYCVWCAHLKKLKL